MEYNFTDIEKKWQKKWVENKTYKVVTNKKKQKFYVLNMFPYPSGAGLHVGHPLGYIASDIYARYKRLKLRCLWIACRAVCHSNRTAPGYHNRKEHCTIPRTIGQNRLLFRLGPRSAHLRPAVLSLDAVGISAYVRVVLRL